MIVKNVSVTQVVSVTVDETKFTNEFLAEFRRDFYRFHTLDDHIEHLGQLYARGLFNGMPDEFVEGYGPAREFGIAVKCLPDRTEIEVVE